MEDPVRSEARIATALAQCYMTQLCKHFEHRLAVSRSDAQGSIAFPTGTCRFEAEPGCLILRAEAPDPDALARLEGTVARHLQRFAFRDPPMVGWNCA
jgi:uncharacterized protein